MICFIIRRSGVAAAARTRIGLSVGCSVMTEELPCCLISVRNTPTLRSSSFTCSRRPFVARAAIVRCAGPEESISGVYGGNGSKLVICVVA